MGSGERPIGAAKGKQSDTEALCQTPPPFLTATPMPKQHRALGASVFRTVDLGGAFVNWSSRVLRVPSDAWALRPRTFMFLCQQSRSGHVACLALWVFRIVHHLLPHVPRTVYRGSSALVPATLGVGSVRQRGGRVLFRVYYTAADDSDGASSPMQKVILHSLPTDLLRKAPRAVFGS